MDRMIRQRGRLTRLVSDPFVWFVGAGVVFYAGYASLWPQPEAPGDLDVVVDETTVLGLRALRRELGQSKDGKSIAQVVDEWVEDELLFREGMRLGLHRDDLVVRRRVIQKMRFLAEESVPMRGPGTQVLAAFLSAHEADFREAPRITLKHVYFSRARRGANLERDAIAAREELARGSIADATTVGDASMVDFKLASATASDLNRLFGNDFGKAAFALKEREWSGPVGSARGVHLVYVEKKSPERVPPLPKIREKVLDAWWTEQKTVAKDRLVRELEQRYRVRIEPGALEAKSGEDAP
jgi:hypothetical protein